MGRPEKLEKILGEEKVILVDNCLINAPLIKSSYTWRSGKDMDQNLIKKCQEELEGVYSFLEKKPKVLITQEIYNEFKRFEKIYLGKQRFLEFIKKEEEIKKEWKELAPLIKKVKERLKESIRAVKHDFTHQILFEMIDAFNQKYKLKRELKNPAEEEKEESKGDESLVVLGLYLSLAEKTPSIILTRDKKDIFPLLRVPYRIMLNEFYRPYNFILHYN